MPSPWSAHAAMRKLFDAAVADPDPHEDPDEVTMLLGERHLALAYEAGRESLRPELARLFAALERLARWENFVASAGPEQKTRWELQARIGYAQEVTATTAVLDHGALPPPPDCVFAVLAGHLYAMVEGTVIGPYLTRAAAEVALHDAQVQRATEREQVAQAQAAERRRPATRRVTESDVRDLLNTAFHPEVTIHPEDGLFVVGGAPQDLLASAAAFDAAGWQITRSDHCIVLNQIQPAGGK